MPGGIDGNYLKVYTTTKGVCAFNPTEESVLDCRYDVEGMENQKGNPKFRK